MFLVDIVDKIFMLYMIMLFIRVFASWLPELEQYRFMHFIRFYTDPYLNLFRKLIPPLGMIDLSPIFAFLALGFIEQFIKYLVVLVVRWVF